MLPENLINQIAAGEVVERPASVVKELIENSLDAGARRLIIEMERGGDDYLRITDDGHGMDKEDALMAFERHATSKIASPEDLDNISSMGFRGEALATIASVSHMSLQTKKKGNLEGTLILNEGGKIVKNKQLGCPEGTQIEIKKLFYNTPARKKYLKNDTTEYGHILDTVTGMALAFPEIAFKLVHDKKIIFDLPATEDHLSRIRGLLGRNVSQELIPVFYGHSKIHLSGYIGKPLIARSNRKNQYLFVNGRQVNSHVLSYAVKQSYHSLLPKEKHPTFVLFLALSPELVDVNVHPRKMEVRFADEKEIFSVFLRACKTSLEKHVLAPKIETRQNFLTERDHQTLKVEDKPAQIPAFSDKTSEAVTANVVDKADQQEVSLEKQTSEDFFSMINTGAQKNEVEISGQAEIDQDKSVDDFTSFSPLITESADNEKSEKIDLEKIAQQQTGDQASIERRNENELKPLAQLNNSYILCSQGETLTIMDQHAAHERIRYEEILAQFENNKPASQPLLTPEQFELSHQEASLLNENKDLLSKMGFEIEPFGGNTYSVFAVPSYLVQEEIRATVMGIIDDITNNSDKGDLQSRKERALTYAACRSAVKFGDKLDMEEMERLCKRIFEMKLPYTCPHGRPTMVKITKDELEKMFGRKY